jgi:hypothetical protein
MRIAIAILVLVLSGCAIPFDSLEGRIDEDLYVGPNRAVSTMKSHYFTEQAQEAIRDIPCVFGATVGGSYVVGANFWGTFIGILSGSGYSRKNVMSKSSLLRFGPEAVLHEYIHHLDSIGRYGGIEFINLEEFKEAYIRMATDQRWAGLVHYAEPRANDTFTDMFGIGEMSEHIAYVGGKMAAQGGGPDYMWDVFRKVLKKP